MSTYGKRIIIKKKMLSVKYNNLYSFIFNGG